MPKKNSKSRKSTVRKFTKQDVYTSVAIASIAFNILLLCIIYVVVRPDVVDYSLYTGIHNKFCSNPSAYSNMQKDATKNGQSQLSAQENYEIACQSGSFAPYYQQAVNAYKQAQK